MNIAEHYGLSTSYVYCYNPTIGIKNTFCCGIELEIEGLTDHSGAYLNDMSINVENDGSLRNHGKEYLLPPRSLIEQVTIFDHLHHKGALIYGPDAFSERTSIHVHVNMLLSTPEQTHKLLLLYSIYEPLFFNYVGINRRNNIHCVPLINTTMSSFYRMELAYIVDHWHKYTALNLIPLKNLGTVEFRHLEGGKDVARFKTWLETIQTLWLYAHDGVPLLLNSNNLNMDYLHKLEKELKTTTFIQQCVEPVDYILEDNLIDVKLSLIGN